MGRSDIQLKRKTNYFDPSWGCGIQPERFEATIKYSKPGNSILDLGCGSGAYTISLNMQGYPTVGIDTNTYPEWGNHPPQWFMQADSENLPFESNSFDTTILFEVLEHCLDPKKTLNEIHRCTTDYLVLSVPNCDLNNSLRKYDLALAHWTDPTHCNFFTESTICELLKENNFEILEILPCYRIDPNDYFWDTLRLPRLFRKAGKKIFNALNFTEIYYSSILIVAKVIKP